MQQIAPEVFAYRGAVAEADAINRGGIANLGVVIGERGLAVVDRGSSVAIGTVLLKAIRTIADKPTLFVNTHEYPDHVFGNKAFVIMGAVFV